MPLLTDWLWCLSAPNVAIADLIFTAWVQQGSNLTPYFPVDRLWATEAPNSRTWREPSLYGAIRAKVVTVDIDNAPVRFLETDVSFLVAQTPNWLTVPFGAVPCPTPPRRDFSK